ncbi:hypothetical protein OH492_14645 [Vibrio chagasii]|nr:hypothetical protein [Vibrio chagasii]
MESNTTWGRFRNTRNAYGRCKLMLFHHYVMVVPTAGLRRAIDAGQIIKCYYPSGIFILARTIMPTLPTTLLLSVAKPTLAV